MKTITCLCFLILTSNSLISQDTIELFPYVGGYSAFEKDLKESLYFPTESVKEANYGVLLLQINTDNSGLKSIQELTFIDENISEVMSEVLNKTNSKWLTSEGPKTFYQPLVFSPGDYNSHMSKNDIAVAKGIGSLLKPIEIVGVSYTLPAASTNKQKIVNVTASASTGTGAQRDFNQDDSRDFSNGNYPVNNPNAIPNTPKMTNLSKLLKQIDKYLKKSKKQKAYEALNEYLRYDPFNEERLIQRMEIEEELGLNKSRIIDEKLLLLIQKTK